MSYSVWLDFDKPLTALIYPPPGKKPPKSSFPLGGLPDCYYETGNMNSKALKFPTKQEAQQVANLIQNATVQKDENL
jgi:hypothetical protein